MKHSVVILVLQSKQYYRVVTVLISLDVCIFARLKANCEVLSLRTYPNFTLVMSHYSKDLRGALGHGLFGLCVNPSLPLAPVVTPLITVRSDAPQQINLHRSNQRHKKTLDFRRGKIVNWPEFLRHFEEKRIGEFCRAMVQFQKLAQKYPGVFSEFF